MFFLRSRKSSFLLDLGGEHSCFWGFLLQRSLGFLNSEHSHTPGNPEVVGNSVALCRNSGLPGGLCAGGAESVFAGAGLHHAPGLGSQGQLPHWGQCGNQCWWSALSAIWLTSRDCPGPGSGELGSNRVHSLSWRHLTFHLRVLAWQWCRMWGYIGVCVYLIPD